MVARLPLCLRRHESRCCQDLLVRRHLPALLFYCFSDKLMGSRVGSRVEMSAATMSAGATKVPSSCYHTFNEE